MCNYERTKVLRHFANRDLSRTWSSWGVGYQLRSEMLIKKSPGNRSYVKRILLLWAQIFFFCKETEHVLDAQSQNQQACYWHPRLAIDKSSNPILLVDKTLPALSTRRPFVLSLITKFNCPLLLMIDDLTTLFLSFQIVLPFHSKNGS